MARRAPQLSLFRRIALLAMLLPFLALSSLPSGTMPGRASDGTLTLVLCTAEGPREVTLDMGDHTPKQSTPACPFAVLQAVALLPETAPQTAAPSLVLAADFTGWRAAHLHPAPLPGPRTARAPPTLA